MQLRLLYLICHLHAIAFESVLVVAIASNLVYREGTYQR